ncbi:hypothetical protein GCM10022268_23230 [Sphingomonas cynarae]|uniref:TonB-dependent receptor n=1 Tax=Sphingomonas cynarae TaxID=930197 RepID=A0ABP7E4Z0_9SPHN
MQTPIAEPPALLRQLTQTRPQVAIISSTRAIPHVRAVCPDDHARPPLAHPQRRLAFDIVNLLGNPLRRYRQFNDAGDQYARQIVYLERTYSLGVRFRF